MLPSNMCHGPTTKRQAEEFRKYGPSTSVKGIIYKPPSKCWITRGRMEFLRREEELNRSRSDHTIVIIKRG